MAELTTAVNELLKGKKPQDNLKVYTGGLGLLYKRISYLRLSMNYFTLAEMYSEFTKDKKNTIKDTLAAVQKLIKTVIIDGTIDTDIQETAAKARDFAIVRMEELTSYIDDLRIYEYMLNRVEFKFKPAMFNNDYYNEKFEKDIIHYVTNENDSSVINMKLASVIEQLPMRLSQNKFNDILKESLSLYKGSEKQSVKDFVYMIRTSGTLTHIEKSSFKQLEKYSSNLSNVDYENIDEKTFDFLRNELDCASDAVADISDAYVALTEVINDIYSIILIGDISQLYDVTEKEKLRDIINKTYEFINGDGALAEEDAMVFTEFEGLQEKIGSMLLNPESAMDGIITTNTAAITEFGYENIFDNYKKISRLQSTSTFASLNEEPGDLDLADEEYINEITAKLITEFEELFLQHDRKYKRAVMASVISGLPTFFNNLDEFESYVHVALGQCSDEAERAACMSLINMLITSEQNYEME